MSNFTFLQADFPELFTIAKEAEMLCMLLPKQSATTSRSVLEIAVNWLYDHDRYLQRPFRDDLSTLLHEPCFKSQFNSTMLREMNLIRKYGNAGAHGKSVSKQDALASLKYLFRFTRVLAIHYGKTEPPQEQTFDESLLTKQSSKPSSNDSAEQGNRQKEAKQQNEQQQKETLAQLQKAQAELAKKEQALRDAEIKRQQQAQENEQLKAQYEQELAELAARKVEREKAQSIEQAVPLEISEAETRKRYIDISLAEAGWTDLQEGYHLEFEVAGMPSSTNPSGKGYVDYVLWGDDGLPLALIEAKRSLANPRKGKHQAELYADCLEKMKGQRPVIFYSNGFETYLWDDQFATEREVQGFYTKDELQLMVARRKSRTDVRTFQVNKDIAGRAYQLEAIARVAENICTQNQAGELRERARQSLLVMATGSGKTRTAAAIVDMLSKCNWVKRVLFLADRNALVTQAKNNFNEYLPNLSAIDVTKEKEDNNTRLVFSTYPTIMNRIDATKTDDERFYGVGHFDLIIVDEAHRSVYQKYKAIFSYFDAMLVGLTATPKKEIHHDTYGLFGIEDDNPTFAYELDKAVADQFLVPPQAYSVPLKFMREGVKYAELSDSEKSQYEETFGDPTQEEAPDEIGSSALNQWLFNTDTVDQVLHLLMQDGIKVEGGDKLGKTIIFCQKS